MYYAVQYRKAGPYKIFLDCSGNPCVYSTMAEGLEVMLHEKRQEVHAGGLFRVVKVDIVVLPYTEQ